MATFEEEISKLNSFYFLREHTYKKNQFDVSTGQYELADNIVSLDNVMIVYQLKERDPTGKTTPEKWFENKITSGSAKSAKKQIKDTIRYLDDYSEIKITNEQGFDVTLSKSLNSRIHKIILYTGIDVLPSNSRNRNFYISRDVGVIHIFHSSDYKMVVGTLITIAELEEYLTFREALIIKFQKLMKVISEEAVLGQFLSGFHNESPSEKNIIYVRSLKKDYEAWDVLNLLQNFKEKTVMTQEKNDYHHILKEIAKLKRDQLRIFKERYLSCIHASLKGEGLPPRTMAFGCGFVFDTCKREEIDLASTYIHSLATLYKYKNKLEKCVGAIFIGDQEGYFNIIWCYIESPFTYDPYLEERVLESNLLPSQQKQQAKNLYEFYDAIMIED
jgi:hypothetical protein